jgi:hypothetical protein
MRVDNFNNKEDCPAEYKLKVILLNLLNFSSDLKKLCTLKFKVLQEDI